MNLVINSQFRPFTFDEMVKPLAMYKEAYDKLYQEYSDLTAQTEMWKDVANQTNSPEAYKLYKEYSDELAAVTEDFSKGMNLSNRRALLGMKRRYNQDIIPIANADAAMKAANELRVKASPDAIFEVGEYNSLDQFLHGKTANNNYTSREALTKKTAAMTEAAMAEALRDPEFQREMGDQFWLITQHTGGSYEDLMQAIANNPNAQNRFVQIKQKVMADTGIDRYDSRGRAAIEDAINTGLYAGLDKPVRSFQANVDHTTPAQAHSMSIQNAQLEMAREEHNWKMKANEWAAEARNPLYLGNNKYLDPTVNLTYREDEDGNKVYDLDYLKNPNNTKTGTKTGSSKTGNSSKRTVNRDTKLVQIGTRGKQAGKTTPLKSIPSGAILKGYYDLTAEERKQADIFRQDDDINAYTWYVTSDGWLIPVARKTETIDADANNETDSTSTNEGL